MPSTDHPLRVYSTLTRRKEPFEPVHAGKVGMYLCGPTVYKPPHIGHMVGPVIFDAIKRYLTFKGFGVTWVVNITDVDDKLIEAAAKYKTTVNELAEKYTKQYLECLALLGIDGIDHFPKASEHMVQIIDICNKLIAKGCAYANDGNVWFEVGQDADYGKLSNRRVEEQEAGTRTLEGGGKRNAADFALWKSAKPGEPAWDSPWGRGRPGWHIECSAMSMQYLGQTMDIHGGGMDLIFPHHENEIAQSESLTGKPLARYWLHNGLTRIKTKLAGGELRDEKMSGSIGNVVSARELIDKYGPELLRYMLLSTHYRSPIEFSDEVLAAAGKGLATFTRLLERVQRLSPAGGASGGGVLAGEVAGFEKKFIEAMDDDFNTAGAIAALHEMAGAINSFIERQGVEKKPGGPEAVQAAAAAQALKKLGGILGLFATAARPAVANDDVLDKVMGLMIRLRQEARAAKNFALADGIRNGLAEVGITLEDRAGETGWRKS